MFPTCSRPAILSLLILGASWGAAAADDHPFTLRPGDHVAVVGNVLAERMQHDGWLETLIQHRFPEHELSFRELGFSGDEVDTRQRSPSFGSPDDWLRRCEADVVLAFFGANESFADEAGLESFRQRLAQFIDHTRSQTYNGSEPPRLVLVSPHAFENLRDPNLPDGVEHNRRLELYTRAMAEVARERKAPFVDLFHPTLQQYATAPRPLTLNGHYLNEEGNWFVATVIDQALFSGPAAPGRDSPQLARIRDAVRDKNFQWFHRYRTTDGFNVYGGRSQIAYADKITNFEVMQREMEILDALTAERDRRVWALAAGRDYQVDDNATPPFIPVPTNLPNPAPYLGGEEAITRMTLGKGLKCQLFASDEQFPELVNPVQMAFDPAGRLFVAAWPSYPHWRPKDAMDDKLLILVDRDQDGRADEVKTFAGGLNNPTGFEFWNGGVLVAMAPDLLFLKDTDGDDVADVRLRVLHGLDSADTHHTANSFTLGPDGALYFQEGTFHMSQVEALAGSQRNTNGCVWRFEPRTWRVDRYVPFNFANPHGHVFTRWGQDVIHDGTGAVPYHATLFSGHVDFPEKQSQPPTLYQQRTRPCPGTEILSSRHFPEEFQGNLLVANVIGVQGILRYRIDEQDSSLRGEELEPLLLSSDTNFRPSDLEVGPDGALYVIDWQNQIIGHLQHHIRDPNRDKTHGRVYRITHEGRPLSPATKIAGATIEELLGALQSPEDRVRYRARIELSGRDTDEVLTAAAQWLDRLDPNDPDAGHHQLEALWLHQQHNRVNEELLRRLLEAPDHRVRAAATRVLCYWQDRVPGALDLLRQRAADANSQVRIQAVRAASFSRAPEAVEIPLIAAELPSDRYLDFVRDRTLRTLEPYWKRALEEGRRLAVTSEVGMRFLLVNLSTAELLKLPRDRAVLRELLRRDGIVEEVRRDAVSQLAKLDGVGELDVLLGTIQTLGEGQNQDEGAESQSVVVDLVRLLTGRTAAELRGVRPKLVEMATTAKLPLVRRIGYVALIAADGGIDEAWRLGARSVSGLRDVVSALPLVEDPAARAALYPLVLPLLDGLPAELADPSRQPTVGVLGRFVRIELPGRRRTLTLAEVEVVSDGANVARGGKASQINTAHNGPASRAIDGNQSGSYGDGGQTHSAENIERPWWELDLGREAPIESIVIHNRTDGNLGERLDNFTLTILDGDRRPVFESVKNPAPRTSVAIDVSGGGPEALVRRAAIQALGHVRGREAETFTRLATLVREGIDRTTAIRALQRIPSQHWPQDQVAPLLANLLAHIEQIPPQQRTSGPALDALQLGDSLAALLPPDEAQRARDQLGDLGVRVLRVGTLPHRMAYDLEQLVVQAGKPVHLVFENSDLMPHNLVITRPGALEEIGLLAEATAQTPDAPQRHYVPRSPKILLSSDLLATGQSQELDFVAPTEPGVYPYVCTYPGHWRRMFGALYVVGDLRAYQADPQAYLEAHPAPLVDSLLKHNRPRTEWTFADLEEDVDELHGRSYANAWQMFQVAACVSCHRVNDVGQPFGPDLTKTDPKLGPRDLLRELLEPSARINEKFATQVFALESGERISGLVIEETDETVKLVDNPLAKKEPIVIRLANVEARKKSDVSLMPKGLLDKLSREEILDLVAYLIARGDKEHAVFQGGGHAHGHGAHGK